MDTTLKVCLSGRADQISPATMAAAFTAFVALLDAPNNGIRWQMTQVSIGSLTLAASPCGQTRDEELEGFTELVSGLKLHAKTGKVPESWSDKGREALKSLGDLATEPGVENVTATAGSQTITFHASPKNNPRTQVKTSIGSLTGKIDRINTRGGCEFGLIDETEKHPVRVIFQTSQLEEIKQLVGKRVCVRGELARNQQGRKESLQMRRIEEIEDHADLPTVDDLVGIWRAPRQAMSAEEIVQEMRRA